MLPDADDLGCFTPGTVLATITGETLTVGESRPHRDRGVIVRFEGVGTRAEAERLRGAVLTISASERRSLGVGEYWPEELVGLVAVGEGGEVLGEVTGVELGSQDRLVVTTPSGAEVLVPFVADLVGDPEGGRIVIAAPPGLFDPE